MWALPALELPGRTSSTSLACPRGRGHAALRARPRSCRGKRRLQRTRLSGGSEVLSTSRKMLVKGKNANPEGTLNTGSPRAWRAVRVMGVGQRFLSSRSLAAALLRRLNPACPVTHVATIHDTVGLFSFVYYGCVFSLSVAVIKHYQEHIPVTPQIPLLGIILSRSNYYSSKDTRFSCIV